LKDDDILKGRASFVTQTLWAAKPKTVLLKPRDGGEVGRFVSVLLHSYKVQCFLLPKSAGRRSKSKSTIVEFEIQPPSSVFHDMPRLQETKEGK
jgi:hypothetical protein